MLERLIYKQVQTFNAFKEEEAKGACATNSCQIRSAARLLVVRDEPHLALWAPSCADPLITLLYAPLRKPMSGGLSGQDHRCRKKGLCWGNAPTDTR